MYHSLKVQYSFCDLKGNLLYPGTWIEVWCSPMKGVWFLVSFEPEMAA